MYRFWVLCAIDFQRKEEKEFFDTQETVSKSNELNVAKRHHVLFYGFRLIYLNLVCNVLYIELNTQSEDVNCLICMMIPDHMWNLYHQLLIRKFWQCNRVSHLNFSSFCKSIIFTYMIANNQSWQQKKKTAELKCDTELTFTSLHWHLQLLIENRYVFFHFE